MLDADRPITKISQDRLNRSVFAKYLARCLLDHPHSESLSIGLYGGFGTGKTSIINMMMEELNFAASNMLDEDKPIILNFNAWSYSNQGQLIHHFFQNLSATLQNTPYLENAEQMTALLSLYISCFTQPSTPKIATTKYSLLEKISFLATAHKFAAEPGQDLTWTKQQLNQLLSQQKHKIIIFIDNISRLHANEIKQIFQIVKSLCDYANTAYVLALDKNQVIRSLNQSDSQDSEALLEKIIQLPFEIPPILQFDLEKIFADRLNTIIDTVPPDTWHAEYWAELYYNSLKYFFVNCRDITRYINILNFSYTRLRDIVNPMDYFALTAIEVFLPEVYAGIRANKDLFSDLLDNVYILDKEKIQKDKLRCTEILARNQRVPQSILLELLFRLFPRIRKIYQPTFIFYHSDTIARKWRRICSPDLFDVYFRLSMQSSEIVQSELATILQLATNAENFDQAITRLNQDDRITLFLDQLDSVDSKTIPREHIEAIISALLDNGDLFPAGVKGPLSLDTPTRIHRITHALLRRFAQTHDRFTILKNAISKATKSIFIIVHELNEQGREHLEETDTFLPLIYRDLSPEELLLLQQIAVNRIKSWAENASLISHPQLMAILLAWQQWDESLSCQQYVEQVTQTDRGLVAFLTAALNEPINQAMTQYEKNPEWEKSLNNIEKIIPASRLQDHAKQLFEDPYFEKLRENEQLAIMIFLDLIHAKTIKFIPNTTV